MTVQLTLLVVSFGLNNHVLYTAVMNIIRDGHIKAVQALLFQKCYVMFL